MGDAATSAEGMADFPGSQETNTVKRRVLLSHASRSQFNQIVDKLLRAFVVVHYPQQDSAAAGLS